jgi:hypothetical protein
MTGPNTIFGTWPVADIIMMSDYQHPERLANGGVAGTNGADRRVRIHMDIPYGTDNLAANDIETKIQSGDLDGAYRAILKEKYIWPLPNPIDPNHQRAVALLAAAFGQFDGMQPPAPAAHERTERK